MPTQVPIFMSIFTFSIFTDIHTFVVVEVYEFLLMFVEEYHDSRIRRNTGYVSFSDL